MSSKGSHKHLDAHAGGQCPHFQGTVVVQVAETPYRSKHKVEEWSQVSGASTENSVTRGVIEVPTATVTQYTVAI
jgi:hypothetical protein